MIPTLAEFVRALAAEPSLIGLVGALLMLLVIMAHTSRSLRRLHREEVATTAVLAQRLAEIERALGDIDPSMAERRNENLAKVLRSLLDYSEMIRPKSDHEREKLNEEVV